MLEDLPTVGSIKTSDTVRRQCAARSLALNCRNRDFCDLFPELVELHRKRQAERIAKFPTEEEAHKQMPPSDNNIDNTAAHVDFNSPYHQQIIGVIAVCVIVLICVWNLKEAADQIEQTEL